MARNGRVMPPAPRSHSPDFDPVRRCANYAYDHGGQRDPRSDRRRVVLSLSEPGSVRRAAAGVVHGAAGRELRRRPGPGDCAARGSALTDRPGRFRCSRLSRQERGGIDVHVIDRSRPERGGHAE